MEKHSKRSVLRAAILILLPILMIIAEAQPKALAMIFSDGPGLPDIIRYYSWFDFAIGPWGDWLILFTAYQTCIILLLALVHLFLPIRPLRFIIALLSGLALAELLFYLFAVGFDNSPVVGFIVAVLLAIEIVIGLLPVKQKAEA